MAFNDFVGHEALVRFLRRLTERRQIPHAWLFSGPARVGKRTLAINWAKVLNCQSPIVGADGIDACERCSSCRHLDPTRPSYAQTHPAVQIVDTLMAAYWEAMERSGEVDVTKLKPKLSLGINAIRTLRENLTHQTTWRYRVLIVDEAERLTEEAAAALLKMLEEPPERTLFVLVSANPWAIPPTIRSRCQPLRFRLVPSAVIATALRERGASPEAATLLARLARGRIGWALEALRNPEWQQERERVRSLFTLMANMEWWDIFRFAELCVRGMEEAEGEQETAMATQRRALEELLTNLTLCWRDVVAAVHHADDLIVNADWQPLLERVAAHYGQAFGVLQQLRTTARRLRPPLNANPQLALELLAAAMLGQRGQ